MSRVAGLILALAVLASVPAACSSGPDTVTGIVVEVDGDLTTVSRFVLVFPDGTRREFVPDSGILFHDRAPISHLRDHLRSGEPVGVVFETLDDGSLVAVEVFDPTG